jgi:hypothetical protein
MNGQLLGSPAPAPPEALVAPARPDDTATIAIYIRPASKRAAQALARGSVALFGIVLRRTGADGQLAQ